MRAIQLDVQSSKQSAEIFKEVTDGQIVMTNGWGQSILRRLQWQCERLIVVRPDSAIQPDNLNVGEMIKTTTIEQGFQVAKELQQADENLIVMCCYGTLFAYRVFATTRPRNWLDRTHAFRGLLSSGKLVKPTKMMESQYDPNCRPTRTQNRHDCSD
jgi:hypothetical protein